MITTALIRVADPLTEAKNLLRVHLEPTGSRVICPGVAGILSDFDYVGVVDDLRGAAEKLLRAGWAAGSSIPCNDDGVQAINSMFISLKKHDNPLSPEVNLILTQTKGWYDSFMLATRVATQLGLTVKEQRIRLFQALLYGNG